MLGHLIRREMLDQVLSFRFLILSAVAALVIWASLFSGYVYYLTRLEDYRTAQTATEERIQELMADDRAGLADRGFDIHKPPTPLSLFARGLDPILPTTGNTGWAAKGLGLKWSPAELEPLIGLYASFDLSVIVQMVLSLFVLLFTYDAVCGEKEGATLSLLASFPVPRHTLLLGKFLGVSLPVGAAFGLPLLLGIAAVLAAPEVQMAPQELVRLALALAVFALYLVLFICAGLLASCLSHRSATSFVILLAFWVASVGVLPRLSLIVADWVRPAPSVHQLQTKKEALLTIHQQKLRDRRTEWLRNYLGQKGLSHWAQTPEAHEAYRKEHLRLFWERTKTLEPMYARLDEAFRNRYNARLDLALAFARVSPAFVFKHAILLLSDTGLDRYQRFFSASDQYMKHYKNWRRETHFRDLFRKANPAKYGEYKWDISDLPRFHYQEIWPEENARAVLVDIGLLALWGVIFFAGAYVAVLRYDLR